MSVPYTLTDSVQHWLAALRTFSNDVPVVTVSAHQSLELTDAFFDGSPADDDPWYHLDAGKYDLFLDDSVSTIHLANFSENVEYLKSDTKLVTWYGHDPARHRVVIHSPTGTETSWLPAEELLWFAWDSQAWTLYAHDGKRIMPVYDTQELIDELALPDDVPVWMGWNGVSMDVFTVGGERLRPGLCAVFVGRSQSVGGVFAETS